MELYDPAKHGEWEIRKGEDGRCHVGLVGESQPSTDYEAEPVAVKPAEAALRAEAWGESSGGGQFAVETHLRGFVAQNLELVEPGLELYVDEAADTTGVEYTTPVGRIDILAVDKEGHFVVLEFKVSRGSDAVCGQLLRYMSWVKMHLADGGAVRGCIIAGKVTERLQYATAMVPSVLLMEYELEFKLAPVSLTASSLR